MTKSSRSTRNSLWFYALIIACLLSWNSPSEITAANRSESSEDLKPPQIGATVSDVTIVDIHRRERSLEDSRGKKAVVVAFLGVDCPIANLYISRLNELNEEFAPKGVQFAAINSNPHDSMVSVAAHAQETEMNFPVLKDFNQTAMTAFGAKRTPEVFLLDASFKIRYRGRIDDQYTISHRRIKPKVHDLKNALQQLLNGEKIAVTETAPHGCLIPTWKDQLPAKEVTYSKDIAPIFNQKCYSCHRDGQVGPFALNDYNDAKDWAEPIREAVLEERMPPWHATEESHSFSNNRSLTQEDRDLILKWLQDDCPTGDLAQLPEKPEFSSDWTIGKPDMVVELPKIEKIPASGVIPYRYQLAPITIDKDMWVQATEARPGNAEVVHHIIAYVRTPQMESKKNRRGFNVFDKEGRVRILAGWAPGDMPQIFPEGVGRKIPKGSQIIFEVHYTPTGKKETDRSAIALKFCKEPPEKEVETNFMAQLELEIPPHRFGHEETKSYTFKKKAQILSFTPHMHWRGLAARYDITWPDGRQETLLNVPYYDFNWQSVYRFDKPLEVPQGTKITLTGTWDNSADNPFNPDPTQTIHWGEQTWEEMLAGWMDYITVE